jgi:hypothetical protein
MKTKHDTIKNSKPLSQPGGPNGVDQGGGVSGNLKLRRIVSW